METIAPITITLNISPTSLFLSLYPVVKFPLRFTRLAGCREALRFGVFRPAQRSRRARGYTGFTECIQNPVYGKLVCWLTWKVTHHGRALHDARG